MNPLHTRERAVGVGVVLVTVLLYLPAVFNDFVAWDDALFLTQNARLNPPTWQTLGFYWTHAGFNLYMPVTYTVYVVLAKLSYLAAPGGAGTRLSPVLFHVAGVLLHAIAVGAVFGIACRVVRAVSPGRSVAWPAAAGALLFALHPLQVESVAFAGTMNTPLAGALLLLACAGYLRWIDRTGGTPRRWRRGGYLLSTGLFALALLSKPTAVAGPVLALLLDRAAFRTRSWRASLLDVLPWALLDLPCLIVTRLIQIRGAGDVPRPLWSRGVVAADAVGFYVRKLIVPGPMGIDYGRTPAFVLSHVDGDLLLHVAICAALAASLALVVRRRCAWAVAGIGIFGIAILPNSGLVPFEFQYISTVADRYVYLAMVGPALLLAVAAGRWPRDVGLIGCVAGLALATSFTERQLLTWRDGPTMFRNAIAVNQGSWVARLNLSALLAPTDPAEAIVLARSAVALQPNLWMTHDNLASLLATTDPARAVAEAHIALGLNPRGANIYNNLGVALTHQGDSAGARRAFESAHALAPENPTFAENLAGASKPSPPRRSR